MGPVQFHGCPMNHPLHLWCRAPQWRPWSTGRAGHHSRTRPQPMCVRNLWVWICIWFTITQSLNLQPEEYESAVAVNDQVCSTLHFYYTGLRLRIKARDLHAIAHPLKSFRRRIRVIWFFKDTRMLLTYLLRPNWIEDTNLIAPRYDFFFSSCKNSDAHEVFLRSVILWLIAFQLFERLQSHWHSGVKRASQTTATTRLRRSKGNISSIHTIKVRKIPRMDK